MKRETDSPKPSPRRTGLNPQKLRRLELVNLLSKTGVVTLSNATVGNWLAAGCPRNPDGTLSLVQVCAWLAAERRKKELTPAREPSPSEALAKFKLDRLKGQYFDRAEVVAQFDEAGRRMKVVFEAVERNHGASVGATIRTALAKSFTGIEEMLRADSTDKPA